MPARVDFDIADDGVENRLKALNSYTEKSPSERGHHVIVRAKPLATGEMSKIAEVYTKGHYLTFTGARLGEFPATIETRIDEVGALVADVRAAKGKTGDSRATPEVLNDAYASLGPPPARLAEMTRSEIIIVNDELRAGYCEIDLGEYASMLEANLRN